MVVPTSIERIRSSQAVKRAREEGARAVETGKALAKQARQELNKVLQEDTSVAGHATAQAAAMVGGGVVAGGETLAPDLIDTGMGWAVDGGHVAQLALGIATVATGDRTLSKVALGSAGANGYRIGKSLFKMM